MTAVSAHIWTQDLHAHAKKVWGKHRDADPFDMGSYKDMSLAASSPNITGICHVYSLMVLMLNRCPCGLVNRVTLRQALMDLADIDPACKSTGCSHVMSTLNWADWLADKMRVVLSHIRRMKRNTRTWDSRKRIATPGEVVMIDDLLSRYLPDAADRHEPLKSDGCIDGTCKPMPTMPAAQETPKKRPRITPSPMEDVEPGAPPRKRMGMDFMDMDFLSLVPCSPPRTRRMLSGIASSPVNPKPAANQRPHKETSAKPIQGKGKGKGKKAKPPKKPATTSNTPSMAKAEMQRLLMLSMSAPPRPGGIPGKEHGQKQQVLRARQQSKTKKARTKAKAKSKKGKTKVKKRAKGANPMEGQAQEEVKDAEAKPPELAGAGAPSRLRHLTDLELSHATTGSVRTYIMAKAPGASRKTHVVACSLKQSANHAAIIKKVMDQIDEGNMTKPNAVHYRNQLLTQDKK